MVRSRKVEKNITLKLDVELVKRLDRAAKKMCYSRSSATEKIIYDYLRDLKFNDYDDEKWMREKLMSLALEYLVKVYKNWYNYSTIDRNKFQKEFDKIQENKFKIIAYESSEFSPKRFKRFGTL